MRKQPNSHQPGSTPAGPKPAPPPPPPATNGPRDAAPEASDTPEERWLNEIFTYHAADDADRAAYGAIRGAAKELVRQIKANTPKCADQVASIRKVREAVMTANAARALRGLV